MSLFKYKDLNVIVGLYAMFAFVVIFASEGIDIYTKVTFLAGLFCFFLILFVSLYYLNRRREVEGQFLAKTALTIEEDKGEEVFTGKCDGCGEDITPQSAPSPDGEPFIMIRLPRCEHHFHNECFTHLTSKDDDDDEEDDEISNENVVTCPVCLQIQTEVNIWRFVPSVLSSNITHTAFVRSVVNSATPI